MAEFGRFDGPRDEVRSREFRRRVDAVKPNADGKYLLSELYPSGATGRFDSLREKLFPLTVKNKPSTAFSFPLGDSSEDGWGSSTADPEGTVAYLRRDKTPISNIVTTSGAAGEYNPRTDRIAVGATGPAFDPVMRHEMIHKALTGKILPGQPGTNYTVNRFFPNSAGTATESVGSPRLIELTNKFAKQFDRLGDPQEEATTYNSLRSRSDKFLTPSETNEYRKELDTFLRTRGNDKAADEISRLRKGEETWRSVLSSSGGETMTIGELRESRPGPMLKLPEEESLVSMLRRTITPKRAK
jgi:hypothetical protein